MATFCIMILCLTSAPSSAPFIDSSQNQDIDSAYKHSVNELNWLAGSWTGIHDRAQTEEHWIEPKGGLMLAVNRTVNRDKAAFEFLRIQRKGDSFSYFASPSGRPAVEFPLKELNGQRVVFENLKHDFPQRIIYERKENELNVTVEGNDDGKVRSASWTWQRKHD